MSRARELADQHKTLDVDGGTIKLDGNYPVGTSNVALGNQALDDGSLSGTDLVAVGTLSLSNNTSGAGNVGIGSLAMLTNTTGNYNTAVGSGQDGFVQGALGLNTSGSSNTAIGYQSLRSNTTSNYSTAVGYQAGYSATTASDYNSFLGYKAGYANASAANTGVGALAMDANTSGYYNAAFGAEALGGNTSGLANTALGAYSLLNNTTASSNTALGYQAGYSNTTGEGNTFIGLQAGFYTTGNYNTFIGPAGPLGASGALITTGSKNTILGAYSGNQYGLDLRTANNHIVLSDGDGDARMWINNSGNVVIGFSATAQHRLKVVDSANRNEADAQFGILASGYNAYHFLDGTAYYIGQNSNARGLRIYSGSNTGVGVLLSAGGTSWGSFSDERLKTDIEPIENGVDKLSNLRCVSYRLTSTQTDDEGNPTQKKLGLIAQDLEGVIDEVIDRSKLNDEDETEFLSVRYTEVIPVLVKAIQEQQETITALTARIEALEA